MDWQLSLADLLLLPVTLPVHGFLGLLDEVRQRVDQELYDPQTLQQRLIELQMRYELGDMAEAEYRAGWAEMARRLAEIGSGRTLRD